MKKNELEQVLLSYLKKGVPALNKVKKIPMDKSLVELGYLDSFGIIDTVSFIENKWKIKIEDDELTKEKFGSLNKMIDLINLKLNK